MGYPSINVSAVYILSSYNLCDALGTNIIFNINNIIYMTLTVPVGVVFYKLMNNNGIIKDSQEKQIIDFANQQCGGPFSHHH